MNKNSDLKYLIYNVSQSA